VSAETRLEQLERNVQYLMDRTAILDCIARNARGCDRHDTECVSSSYHPDGIDEHGFAVNPGHKYGEHANAVHTASSQQNMHNITTHLCEIKGDVAHAESYAIGLFLSPDGNTGRLIAGRYLDRLERRNGEWRIVVRRSSAEVMLTGDASMFNSKLFKDMGYLKGIRDKTDPSYQRPLKLEAPAQRW